MAFLLSRNDTFIVISGNEARVFSSSSSCSALSLVARISCEKPDLSSEANAGQEQQSEEAGESSSIPGQILSAALSHSRDLLAICDDYKALKVWNLSNASKDGPSLLCETTLSRRSTALTFSPTDDSVLVADKNGDAYSLQIPQQPGTDKDVTPIRILGHLGMLLDIKMSSCGKFILTCDRDEKIRVSHYPNAYNIHNFHLAHSQFVYRLCIPRDLPGHFISGGGDGAVIFWSLENPRPLYVLNTIEDLNSPKEDSPSVAGDDSPSVAPQIKCLEYSNGHLCVSFNDLDVILVYAICAISAMSVEAYLVQTIQLPSTVWDCISIDDATFVVLTSEKPHLRRFRFAVKSGADEKQNATLNPLVEIHEPLNLSFSNAEDSMEALETSLASATKAPSLFAVLTKSKIDNMKAYLETKEKRLAGGNVRWGGNKKAVSEERTEDACDKPKKMKVAC